MKCEQKSLQRHQRSQSQRAAARMEIETVNNHRNGPSVMSSSLITETTSTSNNKKVCDMSQQKQIQQSQELRPMSTKTVTIQFTENGFDKQQRQRDCDNCSEIEETLQELELNLNNRSLDSDIELLNVDCKSNGSLSGASSSVSTQGLMPCPSASSSTSALGIPTADVVDSSDSVDCVVLTNGSGNGFTDAINNSSINNTIVTSTNVGSGGIGGVGYNISTNVKKRISSSRTPTRKARRIKFYRNGDRFHPGVTIPVSNERYRSYESLFEDLTRLLEESVKIPGAVRTIYTMCGKKISTLDELEDGQSYVCSCNNESFKKIEYNTTSQPLANLALTSKSSHRVSKYYQRPSSPLKNGATLYNSPGGIGAGTNNNTTNTSTSSTANVTTNMANISGINGSPLLLKTHERDSVVHPRIVTLIRNGTKPRKIMRLLLNKRNSPSFEHILTAITQKVKLDTGYVRKVFTLSGMPVTRLADFFGPDDVFFAYGTERVNNPDDFKLEMDEQKALQSIRKTTRTVGATCKGPKPKMPVKSKKTYDEEEASLLNESGIDANDLPSEIREEFTLGKIIGDGNFAVVLKIRHRISGEEYALKIIDKSKCKGKEHYIDAEVRVMKKLCHPHIITLIMDMDQQANMYLVLEYISGGDLFDAITRVTRFSESQARIMINHLALAMSYLHSLSIVHRDIKPENLLVELDNKGNIVELKLADFGLACEVTEPLYAVCGTPTYVAPEILLETGYGLKIDVWAAGIILYILLCGFPPFVSPDNQQEPLFDAIISGFYEFPEPYWSDIGDEVRDLINNMLQSDPDIRFTSEDILDHHWTLGDSS